MLDITELLCKAEDVLFKEELLLEETEFSTEVISDEMISCLEFSSEEFVWSDVSSSDETGSASETIFCALDEFEISSFVLQPANRVNNKINAVRMDIILTSFIMYTSKLSGTALEQSLYYKRGVFGSVI